jgi:hypothetical protein
MRSIEPGTPQKYLIHQRQIPGLALRAIPE